MHLNNFAMYLFDFDDTLVHTVDNVIGRWQRNAVECGLVERPLSLWRERWGGTAVDIVRKVYGHEISEEKITKVVHRHREEIARVKEKLPQIKGAYLALQDLRCRAQLGILTSRGRMPTTDPTKYQNRKGEPLLSMLEYSIDAAG